MTAKTENSLMMALSELRNIEAARLAEEAAERAAKLQKEEAERKRKEAERIAEEQRKLSEQAHQVRVAEAEARLRVVERERSEELSQKAEQLAHELRVTRIEHGLLTAQLGALEDGASSINQRWRWLLLAAVSSCLIIGFAAVLFVGPKLRKVPPPVVVTAPVQVTAPADRIREQIDAEVRRRVESMQQQLLALQRSHAATEQQLANRLQPRRTTSPGVATGPTVDLSSLAADCKDDPLCGVGTQPTEKPNRGRNTSK